MAGFGTPKTKERKYWLQVVYEDGRDDDGYESFECKSKTRNRGIKLLAGEKVNFVLMLDGRVDEGAVAKDHQIIGSLQTYPVDGCKKIKRAK